MTHEEQRIMHRLADGVLFWVSCAIDKYGQARKVEAAKDLRALSRASAEIADEIEAGKPIGKDEATDG